MKFAHNFVQALQDEKYPDSWRAAAIQYKKLKKCIKKVRNELESLGLNPGLLNGHWHICVDDTGRFDRHGEGGSSSSPGIVGFDYIVPRELQLLSFLGSLFFLSFCLILIIYVADDGSKATSYPRLTLVIDPDSGYPVDAFVSQGTMRCLPRIVGLSKHDDHSLQPSRDDKTIEIPLNCDAEFFRMVEEKMMAMDDLRRQQQTSMGQQIHELGMQLHRMTSANMANSKNSSRSVSVWRDIFRLYLHLQIFFSTNEADCGTRGAPNAGLQLRRFQKTIEKSHQLRKLTKEGRESYASFIDINLSLLRVMEFQEINQVALTKILKKFDKQTALHARSVFPEFMPLADLSSQEIGRAVCYVISSEILSVVPQLEDFLCPICFAVAFKPIRLCCGHVFCIRCLVVMQQQRQAMCALCRNPSVMEATIRRSSLPLFFFLFFFFLFFSFFSFLLTLPFFWCRNI